jgi:hypothetical protein
VDDESIAASHAALSALTGSVVIDVFHTLSAGKAGHAVPGRVVPAIFGDGRDAAELGADARANSDEIVNRHAEDRRSS